MSSHPSKPRSEALENAITAASVIRDACTPPSSLADSVPHLVGAQLANELMKITAFFDLLEADQIIARFFGKDLREANEIAEDGVESIKAIADELKRWTE